MKTTSRLLRRGALTGVTVAVLGLTITACGGSDDESDQATPSQSSAEESNGDETTSGSTGSEAGGGLPEGFPDEVPLPDHDKISSASQLSETTWRMLLVVDPEDDTAAENYATALTDAGFEVEVSDPIVSGNSPTLTVDAVVRPPTITLQVMKHSE